MSGKPEILPVFQMTWNKHLSNKTTIPLKVNEFPDYPQGNVETNEVQCHGGKWRLEFEGKLTHVLVRVFYTSGPTIEARVSLRAGKLIQEMDTKTFCRIV